MRIILAAFFILFTSTAFAATFTVDSTFDAVDANIGNGVCATSNGVCTLRAAIQEANSTGTADTIVLPDGRYSITISGSDNVAAVGDLDITQPLTITGASKANTIIDGNNAFRIFHITSNVTVSLSQMSLVNGGASVENGGAILDAATSAALTVSSVNFLYNTATNGGAISSSGPLALSSCTFNHNQASTAGGALNLSGTGGISISDSTFSNSLAGGGGGGALLYTGAVASDSDITISNSIFTDNRVPAAQSGGTIMIASAASDLTLTDADISTSLANNGGCLSFFSTGTLNVSGSQFSNCRAYGRGGAIYSIRSGAVTFSNSTIDDNIAGTFGGGVFFSPDATPAYTFTDLTVTDNISQTTSTGGLYLEYPASLGGVISASGLNVSRNTCYGGGCGILFYNYTTLTLEDSLFDSNLGIATVANFLFTLGGGAYLGGTLAGSSLIQDTTFSDNHIINGEGGGLYIDGASQTVTIDRTTFSNNLVDYSTVARGGGLYANASSLTLKNSTLSGNRADIGGAYFASGPGTVNNCTFSGNRALSASSDLHKVGAVTTRNTIFADPVTSTSCSVAITSGGHNLNEDSSCGLSGVGDINGSDPVLGALADLGGTTKVLPFVGSSPAIDVGDAATCEAVDQLGTARPVDGDGNGTAVCDIGALENTDLCPTDSAKTAPGTCGCGVADADTNSNGIVDCLINSETVSALRSLNTVVGKLKAPGLPSTAKRKQAIKNIKAELATLKSYVAAHLADITLVDSSKSVSTRMNVVNSKTRKLLSSKSSAFSADKVGAKKAINSFIKAITG